MIVSELIELLKKCPQEAEILRATGHGTLVRAMRVGTVKVIPVYANKNLIPGNEWAVPFNDKHLPDTERETHFLVG